MARKIIAVCLLLIGIGAIGASIYIEREVAAGRMKIQKAEKVLEQGDQLFSLNPVTKEIGKGIKQSADKKLGEGKELISQYTTLAHRLKIGGWIAAVVGVVLFFVPQRKK